MLVRLCVCVQFADGVYLVLLMGLLEDYFVPLYNFFLTPESFEQKVSKNWNLLIRQEKYLQIITILTPHSASSQVHNVAFAFELMQDGGLKKPKARPEGIL